MKLPDGKVLIPGVIESKSNFIEHPELIAQRIGRYAKLVGRENVIAGSDCGYGTWVGQAAVDPDVVFAKLAAMAEGARIATQAVLEVRQARMIWKSSPDAQRVPSPFGERVRVRGFRSHSVRNPSPGSLRDPTSLMARGEVTVGLASAKSTIQKFG